MSENEKPRELTAEQKAQQESFKLLFDVYKHITTLSSGTILILVTFLEKLFKNPKAVQLIPLSISCYLLSIIFSLLIMAHLAAAQQVFRQFKRSDKVARLILYWLAPLTFVLGTISLAVMTVFNLHH
jgi:hypothetical protein